jgi:acyl carrier protein
MNTNLEKTIAAIWQEVLKVQTVGPEENFFDLGGNSLLMIQFHEKLQNAFNTSIPITQLFQHTTIRALAGALSSAEPAARSYQQLELGRTLNPFRPRATQAPETFEERARKQFAAREQFRQRSSPCD